MTDHGQKTLAHIANEQIDQLRARVAELEAALTYPNVERMAGIAYGKWTAKAGNERWARLIDGTPIPNDLIVCIAQAIALLAKPQAADETDHDH